eukprot:GHRQ01013412.1.p3 GENE.GHRQ01013412.1~~GHRQ01013412.1.p3  ORF type:complete len:117 (+),score=41.71 GHRQ01013412.1:332-682(+)
MHSPVASKQALWRLQQQRRRVGRCFGAGSGAGKAASAARQAFGAQWCAQLRGPRVLLMGSSPCRQQVQRFSACLPLHPPAVWRCPSYWRAAAKVKSEAELAAAVAATCTRCSGWNP